MEYVRLTVQHSMFIQCCIGNCPMPWLYNSLNEQNTVHFT